MEKTCFKCNKSKDINDFYVHKQMSDGHLGKCKECAKKDVTDRYYSEEGNKKIIEYEKKRFKDKKRKEKLKIYQLKRRKKYPGKNKCRYILKNAIRDGRIIKKPCQICGLEKSEGHHTDYRSPLKVVWLCRKHHLEVEGKNYWG